MSAPTNSALGTGTSTAHTAGHTPGPWAVSMPGGQTTFNGRRITVTHNGSMVADLDWNSPRENMANAALIARAPDLLAEVTALRASLNDAVELVESLRSERDTKQRACDALKYHIDQQTNASVELRRIVRAMLDDCDRGLFELPCGYFNELRAALGRSAP